MLYFTSADEIACFRKSIFLTILCVCVCDYQHVYGNIWVIVFVIMCSETLSSSIAFSNILLYCNKIEGHVWLLRAWPSAPTLLEEICGFCGVDTEAHPITQPNYHISQFCLVCDNSHCNHIHIHTYTLPSLFKHCPIFIVLCAGTHMHSNVWTGPQCTPETELVINIINYLRNFKLCKHYWDENR